MGSCGCGFEISNSRSLLHRSASKTVNGNVVLLGYIPASGAGGHKNDAVGAVGRWKQVGLV